MKKLMMQALLSAFTLGVATIAAAGPIFNVTATGNILQITTNIPNHTYPLAGVRVNTSGFRVSPGIVFAIPSTECTMLSNGFCQLTLSATQPAYVAIVRTGASDQLRAGLGVAEAGNTSVNVSVCLNSMAALSCQSYTFNYANSG